MTRTTSSEWIAACRNGDWPPRTANPDSWQPQRVPYLETPPTAVNIDCGRQLFVDEYLIERTSMTRVFHQPVKHPANPVLYPVTDIERDSKYPPCAVAKCGGVWYDPGDNLFKVWYMAGYVGVMAYAQSSDGIHWERPSLDIVPGTNICLSPDIHPDSGTIWIDEQAENPSQRFKLMLREPNPAAWKRAGATGGNVPGLMMTSPDGLHWSPPRLTGPMGDRSTMFYNPFSKKWVQSIRCTSSRGRYRKYHEANEFFASGEWTVQSAIPWVGADCLDAPGDSLPELYTLDAVAYESLMLGLFQIFRGPQNDINAPLGRPKVTDICVGFSRDGFHWHRGDRNPFIGPNRTPGAWEYGYVEPSGGCCLVVGDELWFYYSAYAGDPTNTRPNLENGMYANGAVGLATLRRDGFASMQPRCCRATLTTRPLTFSEGRMFVNVDTAGSELRVEAVDEQGQSIEPCSAGECVPLIINSTCAEIRYKRADALKSLPQPVRFRFAMDRGALYAFWTSDSADGKPGGHRAAGGPTAMGNV